MHEAMTEGGESPFEIPTNSQAIGQYLFLYDISSGPDGIRAFVDPSYRLAVVRALSKTDSAAFSRGLLDRLQAYATRRFRGLPVTVGIAGGTLGVQTAMNDTIVREKVVNMLQVSVVIFVLCVLAFRSIVAGLFVLTPLVAAAVGNFGIMGWTGTWLDMSTAAISAMGISIGADFAIYLLFRIRQEVNYGTSLELAMLTSVQTSGKAIVYVSSAIVAGYLVLTISGFSVWQRLGVLTAAGVGFSALATLILIPCQVVLLRPAFLSAPRRARAGLPRWWHGWGRANSFSDGFSSSAASEQSVSAL
jgi:predicted RND superfamily exporter protein